MKNMDFDCFMVENNNTSLFKIIVPPIDPSHSYTEHVQTVQMRNKSLSNPTLENSVMTTFSHPR